jgi:perosamine synthetase
VRIFYSQALLDGFAADLIDGRFFLWPLSMLPMFENKPGNAVSYGLYNRSVNLPSYHDIGEHDLDRVAAVIRASLE